MNIDDELKALRTVWFDNDPSKLDVALDAIRSALVKLVETVNALEASVETLERKERSRQPISFPR